MKRRNRRRRSPSTGLLILCIALGAVVYFELNEERPVQDTGRASATARLDRVVLEPETGFSMPPRDSYSEIVARPLFSPSRRPAVAPEEEPQAGEIVATPSGFVLTGVMIAVDDRFALLRRRVPPDMAWVSVGQVIDGWLVEAIEPNRVVLQNGSLREELVLEDRARPSQRKGPRRRRKAARTADGDGELPPGETVNREDMLRMLESLSDEDGELPSGETVEDMLRMLESLSDAVSNQVPAQ